MSSIPFHYPCNTLKFVIVIHFWIGKRPWGFCTWLHVSVVEPPEYRDHLPQETPKGPPREKYILTWVKTTCLLRPLLYHSCIFCFSGMIQRAEEEGSKPSTLPRGGNARKNVVIVDDEPQQQSGGRGCCGGGSGAGDSWGCLTATYGLSVYEWERNQPSLHMITLNRHRLPS